MTSPPDSGVQQKQKPRITPDFSPASHSTAIADIVPLDIDRLSQAFQKYEEFKQKILTKEDWVEREGKRFYKKSAWRKLEFACAVSDEVIEQERVPPVGADPERGFYWRIATRAYHPATGRSSVGVAIASSAERKSWAHAEHDVYALAATRSKNRAISDLIGGGQVSAEEVTPSESESELSEPHSGADTTVAADTSGGSPAQKIGHSSDAGGLREYPIYHQSKSVGTASIKGQEISLVPEKPVKADSGPIKGFLVGRFLEGVRQKHPESFEFSLNVNAEGVLQSVLVKMDKLETDRLNELLNAAGWAFAKAVESKEARETGA